MTRLMPSPRSAVCGLNDLPRQGNALVAANARTAPATGPGRFKADANIRPRRSPWTSPSLGTRALLYSTSSASASSASRSSSVPENGGCTWVAERGDESFVAWTSMGGASGWDFTYGVVCEVDFSHTVSYVNRDGEKRCKARLAARGQGRDPRGINRCRHGRLRRRGARCQ